MQKWLFIERTHVYPWAIIRNLKLQKPVNILICPSLPPIVVAHCFGSPCCLKLSNNPLGLVPNPNKNIQEIPMDYDEEKKCYQEEMSY